MVKRLLGCALFLFAAAALAQTWKTVTLPDGNQVCERDTSEQFDPRYPSKGNTTEACNHLTDFEAALPDLFGFTIAEAQVAPASDISISGITGGAALAYMDKSYHEGDVPTPNNRIYADTAESWDITSFGSIFNKHHQLRTLSSDFNTTGSGTQYEFLVGGAGAGACLLHDLAQPDPPWIDTMFDETQEGATKGGGTVQFRAWCARLAPGTHSLGGNCPTGGCTGTPAMYTLVFFNLSEQMPEAVATPTVDPPWICTDIGTPPTAGTAFDVAGVRTMHGSGDLDGTSPSGHFCYQERSMPGNYRISKDITSLTGDDPDYKKASVVIFDSLTNPTQWAGMSMLPIGAQSAWAPDHCGRGYTFVPGIGLGRHIDVTVIDGVVSMYQGANHASEVLVDSCEMAWSGSIFLGDWCSAGVAATPALCIGDDVLIETLGSGSGGTVQFSGSNQLTINEDQTPLQVCATRAGGADGTCSVTLSVTGGTATEGVDFSDSQPSTLTWLDQDATPKCANVTIIDRAGEQSPPNRTMVHELTSPSGCTGTDSQTSTILDTDGAGTSHHPGYYLRTGRSKRQTIQGSSGSGGPAAAQAERFAQYDTIADNENIEGIVVYYRWVSLEGAEGDFSGGMTLLRDEYNYIAAMGKRMVLNLLESSFNGSIDDGTAEEVFPQYLIDDGCVWDDDTSDTGQVNLNWGRADCRARYIALWSAIADELGGEPLFEGLVGGWETSILSDDGDFSHSACVNGLKSAYIDLKALFPTKIVWMPFNGPCDGIDQSEMDDFFEWFADNNIGVVQPDMCPPSEGAACLFFNGEHWDYSYDGTSSMTDYRGVIHYASGIESSETGWNSVGPAGGFTAQEYHDYTDLLDATHAHVEWIGLCQLGVPEDGCEPTEDQTWDGDDGFLEIINTQPIDDEDCPTAAAPCNEN
jgi:hypothetical protein